MEGGKGKAESLTATQAVKLRARQFTAVAGDKFKVASASISRGDTQVRPQTGRHAAALCTQRACSATLALSAAAQNCSTVYVGASANPWVPPCCFSWPAVCSLLICWFPVISLCIQWAAWSAYCAAASWTCPLVVMQSAAADHYMPRLAGAVVRRVDDAVQNRVTEFHVRVLQVNLCPQHVRPIAEFADAHLF